MNKQNIWKTIIQTLVTILTAIGTTLGVTSCRHRNYTGRDIVYVK